MAARRFTIELGTEGNTEVVDMTRDVEAHLKGVTGDGVVHVFVVGSTAALTTLEFEPGLVRHDVPNVLQRLVPDDATYEHEKTWNDDNGHSHVRSSLIGPGLSVPFANGKLMLGEWQQIVLIDFDTRPRRRKIIGTILT